MEPHWKIILLRAMGIGIGITIGCALVVLTFQLWASRPAKIAPWNTSAVTAKYRDVKVNSESYFQFDYSLKNNTDRDFTITDSTPIQVSGLTTEGDLAQCSNCVEINKPLMIPAHESLQVAVIFKYKYPKGPTLNSDPDSDATLAAIRAELNDHYKRLDGFVIHDNDTRYEIKLPAGWK